MRINNRRRVGAKISALGVTDVFKMGTGAQTVVVHHCNSNLRCHFKSFQDGNIVFFQRKVALVFFLGGKKKCVCTGRLESSHVQLGCRCVNPYRADQQTFSVKAQIVNILDFK